MGSVAVARTVKPRRVELDVVRVLAITSVLICHALEVTYHGFGLDSPFYPLAHVVGRIGVPFFLFLTGSLVLSKSFDTTEDFARFYRHNLIPLIVTVEIWIVINNIYLVATGSDFSFTYFLKEVFFFEDVPMRHWWYIPVIVGMYAILPFVSVVLKHVPLKVLAIPVCIAVVFFFALPTFSNTCSALRIAGELPGTKLSLEFYGGFCGTYVVLGYLIDKKYILGNIRSRYLIIICLISFIATLWLQTITGSMWYNSLTLLCLAACAYELILRSAEFWDGLPARAADLLGTGSRMSFGVYLCHVPFCDLAARILWSVEPTALQFLLALVIVLPLSFGFVALFWRLPRVRLLLFDAK